MPPSVMPEMRSKADAPTHNSYEDGAWSWVRRDGHAAGFRAESPHSVTVPFGAQKRRRRVAIPKSRDSSPSRGAVPQ